MKNNLAAPCGIYCGACRQYLLKEKNQFEKRGYKTGCMGCRIRNKKCSMIRRNCPELLENKIEFCHECDGFPCSNLEKLDNKYRKKYYVSLIDNLRRIREIGAEKWLKEQEELYTCSSCGGQICIHDEECYDCGMIGNPNKKNNKK